MVVCISRASFLFRSWRRKLQEAGIVDIILSFNNASLKLQANL